MRTKSRAKVWVSILLFVATIIVNFFGGTGRINNMSQGDVSDRYFTLITPASFAFSIWGVIYTLLGISLVMLLVKYKETYYQRVIERTSVLFWLTCLLNMAWIVTFSYLQIGLSSLMIFSYAILLALLCRQLFVIHQNGKWLLPVTFGLYTGWLFIATVVNISAFLVQIEWNGFGLTDDTWAMIMLIVAILLALGVAYRLRNIAFPLSIVWAFWGINRKLSGLELETMTLEWITLIGAVVLLGFAGYTFYRNRWQAIEVTQ